MTRSSACTPPRAAPSPERSARPRGGAPASVSVNLFGEVDKNVMPVRKSSRVERRLGLDEDGEDTEMASSASYSTPRGSWPAPEEGRASHGSVCAFAERPSGRRPSVPLAPPSNAVGTCGGSVGVPAPCWQTPPVSRSGTARLTGGSYGMPVVQTLLYTPQIAPGMLAMRNRLDQELNAVNEANRAPAPPAVTPLLSGKLYIGGFPDEETVAILRAEGIQNVVNCAPGDYRTEPAVAAEFRVRDIDAFDSADYLILHHDLDTFTSIMDDVIERRQEKVFVHCVAGINRSVTLCCAYLMEKLRISPVEVVRLFRANGRMRILENYGFRHQLVDHYLHGILRGTHEDEEEEAGHL